MSATHRIDFSLVIESADAGLEGTPIELGSHISGSFLVDSGVEDIDFRNTVGVFEQAAFSGSITCESTLGQDGEISLGLGEITVTSSLFPGDSDGFNTVFALNQGGIAGYTGFDPFDVGGVGLSFFDNDGLALSSDSLEDAMASMLEGFSPGNGGSAMLTIALQNGRDFYDGIGTLTSFDVTVIPSPGPIALGAVAVGLILGRRVTRG
jgi:hypothetical protein